MTSRRLHTCRECGSELKSRRAEFCGMECRISWRNRRSSRGAELYDLFMAMRYDRAAANEAGLWKIMCRMAQAWNDEDKSAGRRTYFSPAESIERTVRYQATVVAR